MTRTRVLLAVAAVAAVATVAAVVVTRHGHDTRALGLPPEPVPPGYTAAAGPGFSAAVPDGWTMSNDRPDTAVWRPAAQPPNGVAATCAVARSGPPPGTRDAYDRLSAVVDHDVANAMLRDPSLTVVRRVRRAVPGAVAAIEVDTTRRLAGGTFYAFDVFVLDRADITGVVFHDYCAGPEGQVPDRAAQAVAAFRVAR